MKLYFTKVKKSLNDISLKSFQLNYNDFDSILVYNLILSRITSLRFAGKKLEIYAPALCLSDKCQKYGGVEIEEFRTKGDITTSLGPNRTMFLLLLRDISKICHSF